MYARTHTIISQYHAPSVVTWINTFLSHLSHFSSSVFSTLKSSYLRPGSDKTSEPLSHHKTLVFRHCLSKLHLSTQKQAALVYLSATKEPAETLESTRLAGNGVCFYQRLLESCTGHVDRAEADSMTFPVAVMSVIGGFESGDWRVKKDEGLRVN